MAGGFAKIFFFSQPHYFCTCACARACELASFDCYLDGQACKSGERAGTADGALEDDPRARAIEPCSSAIALASCSGRFY